MKKLLLSLLTLTALGTVSFPIHAQEGDSAVVQDARQTAYQTGEYNYSGQSTVQRNSDYRTQGRTGNTGDVMTSDQLSDQYGVGNSIQQRVRQENTRTQRSPYYYSCNDKCSN